MSKNMQIIATLLTGTSLTILYGLLFAYAIIF